MAHTRSAKKMISVIAESRNRNRSVRSSVKTQVAKAETEISENQPEAAQESVKLAMIALDKAARKGVIHKNNAARRKSRLAKKLNALAGSGKAS